jgi:DNA polymerase-3 subunit epsilon
MLICGIDFETTGLNIPTIGVTEVGLVLWDTDLQAPVKLFGTLVEPGSYAIWEGATEFTQAAVDVNGITPEICNKYGMEDEKALKYVLSWYGSADVACAHNGNTFDRPLLDKWAERYGLDSQKNKVWIDTMIDIVRPKKMHGRLTYMAADHGFLNPFPHRAMFDVMTMLTILNKHNLEPVLELAKSPTRVLKALVPFDSKELAKQRGYFPVYENGKFVRWELPVKEINIEKEREYFRSKGFDVEVIR